jgi:alpha-beta hydrolase superfamily lysophospholipase
MLLANWRFELKVKISWKIAAVLSIVCIGVLAGYLLQKPFVPSPYSGYKPIWPTHDLSSLQSGIEKKEKTFPNLKRENEKKMGFNNGPKPTEYAFIYLPGFSATRKEIFPVVETLAKQFSANFFLTRFPAHGESAQDYKDLKAQGLFDTGYEAVELAPKLGKKKIFVATSTGATILSAALVQNLDIDAAVFVSPAFAVYPKNSWLLSTRMGPLINKIFIDEVRSWIPRNPVMEKYWNTSYHRNGLIALLQSVEYVRSLDFSLIEKPVLVLYTKNDDVVVVDAILSKFAEIKDPRKRLVQVPASSHVLAGEFTSPETTDLTIQEIHDWIQSLDL